MITAAEKLMLPVSKAKKERKQDIELSAKAAGEASQKEVCTNQHFK